MARRLFALAGLLTAVLAAPATAQPASADAGGGASPRPAVPLGFPTDNDAVLHSEPAAFYMWLVRQIGDERSRAWEGGAYGYVRNAVATPAGWRFTRFHEGVDIAPLYRDGDGEPLDEVRAVGDGRVVDVNLRASGSDYGRFVLVEHDWGGSPFYTRYAHLATVEVYEGDRVRRGERLGVVGYTGEGLDQERAHLHFEVNLLLNAHFEAWREARHPGWSARRGRYHGTNLAGVDPVAVLTGSREDPARAASEIVADQDEEVTVAAPSGPPPDVLRRYPWLCRSCAGGEVPAWSRSWEVGLTRSGLPVRVAPSERRVSALRLLRVAPRVRADYLPSRLLTGTGPGADLSAAGRSHLALLFTRADFVPPW
jgi:murein DD-endopeptidase MepM/ murein hydrolase activator NlpD